MRNKIWSYCLLSLANIAIGTVAWGGWDQSSGWHLPNQSGYMTRYGLTDLDNFTLKDNNYPGLRAASKSVVNDSPNHDGQEITRILKYPKPTILTDPNGQFFDKFFTRRYYAGYGSFQPTRGFQRLSDRVVLVIRYPNERGTKTWDKVYFDLFKYFRFAPVQRDVLGVPLSANDEKLIVLVHGWNPDGENSGYTGSPWKALINNLTDYAKVQTRNWKVVKYNWASDAATGEVFGRDECGERGKINGPQSAEIAHQHGQHLGQALAWKCPNLRKVHFIAHSAGAWAARSAARYLAQNTSVEQIQITLLDPHIPSLSDPNSNLRKQYIDEMASIYGDKLYLLENYYFIDGSDHYGACTSQRFDWGTPNLQMLSRPIQVSLNRIIASVQLASMLWNGHSYPITDYAKTIKNPSKWAAGGWRESLFYKESQARDLYISLSWGSSPADLDSHLKTPSGTHVNFRNRGSESTPPYVTLDRDDTDGNGPEVISVFRVDQGAYRYFVHQYSSVGSLAGCGARLTVRNASNAVIFSRTVPSSGSGRYWHVFDIIDGGIVSQNILTSEEP